MTVECVTNEATTNLTPWRSMLAAGAGSANSTPVSYRLTIGASYVVYGLAIFSGIACYVICEDKYAPFPNFVPAICFSKPRGELPPFLSSALRSWSSPPSVALLICGQWLTEDVGNYDRLVEGDAKIDNRWQEFKSFVEAHLAL
jgi:hypothetical protein